MLKNPKKETRRKKAAKTLRETADLIMGGQSLVIPKKRVWLLVPFLVSGSLKIAANIIDPETTIFKKRANR